MKNLIKSKMRAIHAWNSHWNVQYFFPILTGIVGIIGFVLWGYPADPDVVFRSSQVFGTLLLSLFFVFCLLGWGCFFTFRFGLAEANESSPQWLWLLFLALALGSAWAILVMGVLGHAGLIGSGKDVFVLIPFALGPYLASRTVFFKTHSNQQTRVPHDPTALGVTILTLFAFGYILLGRICASTLAHGTTDPFVYHLLGPRLWWAQGRISMSPIMPIAYQSSYWEYLLLWGTALFCGPKNLGLIELHLFGQMVHVLIGSLGTLLALVLLFWNTTTNRSLVFSAALAAMCNSSMLMYSYLAKSDWGVAFFCLSGLVFLTRSIGGQRVGLWAGVFGGLAIASKWNMALTFVPALFLFGLLRPSKKTLGTLLVACLFAGLVVFPILARNIIESGNPFYPFFDSWFDSPWLRLEDKFHPEMFKGFQSVSTAFKKLVSLLSDGFGYGLILLPVLLVAGRWCRDLVNFSLTAILGLVFFSFLKFGPAHFDRWLGPVLLLANACGVVILGEALRWLMALCLSERALPWTTPVIPFTCLVVLMPLQLGFYWKHFKTVKRGISPTLVIRKDSVHLGGSSKAWLRLNAHPSDLIVSSGDDEIYYLSGMNVRVLIFDRILDVLTYGLTDPFSILKVLQSQGAKYLLDTQHFKTPYWGIRAYLLDQLVLLHPETVVFEGEGSKVVDLVRLADEVDNRCSTDDGYSRALFSGKPF